MIRKDYEDLKDIQAGQDPLIEILKTLKQIEINTRKV